MNREKRKISYTDFGDSTPVANTQGAVFELVPVIYENPT